LHRRTADLHQDWKVRLARDTSTTEARVEAIEEMLLRLRWDDSNDSARAKLSSIIGRIWDGLEGVDLTEKTPLSSALWLDDEGMMPTQASCLKSASTDGDCDQVGIEDRQPEGDESTIAPSRDSQVSDAAGAATVEPASVVEAVQSVDPAASASQEGDSEVASASEVATDEEVRIARDGNAYSLSGFMAHYGDERGQWYWEEAEERVPTAPEESQPLPGQEPPAEPEESSVVPAVDQETPAVPAPATMDDDLLATFNGLSEELKRSMERFIETWESGSRLKLPSYMKAKQRKALHLWAEQRGLEHRSFGWASRRRLHLTVPGDRAEIAAPQAEDAGQQEEFDWDAWASNDEAHDSQDESDGENW
jgi:hypothetical protein